MFHSFSTHTYLHSASINEDRIGSFEKSWWRWYFKVFYYYLKTLGVRKNIASPSKRVKFPTPKLKLTCSSSGYILKVLSKTIILMKFMAPIEAEHGRTAS